MNKLFGEVVEKNTEKLTKRDIKKIIDYGNIIEVYDNDCDYTYQFLYIYQGNTEYAIFYKGNFVFSLYLHGYIDKIKTRKDAKKYIRKILEDYLNTWYTSNIK